MILTRIELLGALWFSWWRQLKKGNFRFYETLDAVFHTGVQALPMVTYSFAVVSFMMIVELSFQMKKVLHQDSLVPAFSTLLILRELGPILAAVLIASRTGAGMASEVAMMKITDELDAMKVCHLFWEDLYLFPRWIGCILSTGMITLLGVACAVFSGAAFAALTLGYTREQFLNTMFTFTRFEDLIQCGVKALVFGTLVPWISISHGLLSRSSSSGVGNSATGAVVESLIWVIGVDFLIDTFFF